MWCIHRCLLWPSHRMRFEHDLKRSCSLIGFSTSPQFGWWTWETHTLLKFSVEFQKQNNSNNYWTTLRTTVLSESLNPSSKGLCLALGRDKKEFTKNLSLLLLLLSVTFSGCEFKTSVTAEVSLWWKHGPSVLNEGNGGASFSII